MPQFSISRSGYSTEFRSWIGGLCRLVLFLLIAAIIAGPSSASSIETLKVLARAGPWPTLSGAIVFEGRLWVVNSVKGRNHNSADLYSFDPGSNNFAYERHLFSQDAGDPVIHAGHLFWPMEDYRFSLGWGAYAAARRGAWFNGSIPGTQIFHNHAMTSDGKRLYAANSGWTAKINVSEDHGATWRQIYEHPTPSGVVSRITSLTPLRGKLIAQIIVRGVPNLTIFAAGQLNTIKGWPRGVSILGNTVLDERVHAVLSRSEGGSQLWATDGIDASPVATEGIAGTITDIGHDGQSLWAVSSAAGGGIVWKRGTDGRWVERYQLEGGYPRELVIHNNTVFVVGDGNDGAGILWGLLQGDLVATGNTKAVPTLQSRSNDNTTDWFAVGQELDALIAAPERYRAGQNNLRDVVHRIALSGPPARFFSERLNGTLPQSEIGLIGGQVKIPASVYARWVLLWGMGLIGEPRVPLELLAEPWKSASNGAEKYFDPAPAAVWAARAAGQKTNATIETLVARLAFSSDPQWLSVQVAAALRALTGQHFGNDHAEWSNWWTRNRGSWKSD